MQHAEKKIVLHAGEYCFDKAGTHVHTLLGSCISITLWHPQRRIGGMCHFALARPAPRRPGEPIDPRYAEDCMLLFERSIKRLGSNISDYQAKIFGGGNMYDKVSASQSDDVQNQPIGDKNAAIAFRLLMEAGANILVAHVGEQGHRRIVFDIGSGDVWVRFAAAKNSRGDVRSLDGRS